MASPRRSRRGRTELREELSARAQYLTFALGDETFGVEIARVREILEYETPMEIPMVPPYIRGVINLRGAAVPVLDLARRMGRGEGRVSRRSCIVIVEVGGTSPERPPVAIGIMVDGVHRVLEIAADQIEPRPDLGGGVSAEFIHGMVRREGGFMVLLNVEYVFSGADVRLLGGIGESTAAGEGAGDGEVASC